MLLMELLRYLRSNDVIGTIEWLRADCRTWVTEMASLELRLLAYLLYHVTLYM